MPAAGTERTHPRLTCSWVCDCTSGLPGVFAARGKLTEARVKALIYKARYFCSTYGRLVKIKYR